MSGSDLAKGERKKWAGDEPVAKPASKIEYIGQLKSGLSGKKGKSFWWGMTDPNFTLASDLKIGDDVVIYYENGQIYWQRKDLFLQEFDCEAVK